MMMGGGGLSRLMCGYLLLQYQILYISYFIDLSDRQPGLYSCSLHQGICFRAVPFEIAGWVRMLLIGGVWKKINLGGWGGSDQNQLRGWQSFLGFFCTKLGVSKSTSYRGAPKNQLWGGGLNPQHNDHPPPHIFEWNSPH